MEVPFYIWIKHYTTHILSVKRGMPFKSNVTGLWSLSKVTTYPALKASMPFYHLICIAKDSEPVAFDNCFKVVHEISNAWALVKLLCHRGC